MIQKKEAETTPVSLEKPIIDKPVRARKTKVTKPVAEPFEITEPVIEEIITETIEISTISQEDDSAVSNKKKSKNETKKKVKMKDKDKKKAKKADAKEKAKQKAEAVESRVQSFGGDAMAYALSELATAGGNVTITTELLAAFRRKD